MVDSPDVLRELANDFAAVIPEVDALAAHDRWKAGIGPFEEDRQIKMLREALQGKTRYSIDTEEAYLDGGQKCDLLLTVDSVRIPVEVKLLRFRYDNGNIDPNSFAKVFSPFPERTSSSLLTDARKLQQSGFEHSGGLLGLYYEAEDEEYETLTAETIAEKFCIDINYWYDFQVETRQVAHFEGLRHPVHQEGAVITWEIIE